MFDFPVFLLALNYIVYNSLELDHLKTIVRIIALLILLIGWLIKGEKKFTYLSLIFVLFSILQLLINGFQALTLIAFIVVAYSSNRILDVDIKHFNYIGISLIVIMIVLVSFGFVDNTTYVSNLGRTRTTLGFSNPNTSSLFYSSFVFLYVLSREKLSYLDIAVALFYSLTLFYFTDSRTMLFTDLFFLFFVLLNKVISIKGGHFPKHFFLVLVDTLIIGNFISVFLLDYLMRFDSITSYRISAYSNMVASADMMTWLFGGSVLSVDSFYYMLLFNYGLLFYFVFFVLVHYSLLRLSNDNNTILLTFIASFFVCGITESSIIRPEVLSMLLIWKIIINDNSTLLTKPVFEKNYHE